MSKRVRVCKWKQKWRKQKRLERILLLCRLSNVECNYAYIYIYRLLTRREIFLKCVSIPFRCQNLATKQIRKIILYFNFFCFLVWTDPFHINTGTCTLHTFQRVTLKWFQREHNHFRMAQQTFQAADGVKILHFFYVFVLVFLLICRHRTTTTTTTAILLLIKSNPLYILLIAEVCII